MTWKRMLSALLCVALVLTGMPLAGFAEGTEDTQAAQTDPPDASQPLESVPEPVEETTAPTEETTAPTEATTVPTEETTVPTEATTAPTEATTAPTEETTVPTEETTVPTQEPAAPTQAQLVQAMIDALPEAGSITAENAQAVRQQLAAIDEAVALATEPLDGVDVTRYYLALEALSALESQTAGVAYIDEAGMTQTCVDAEPLTADRTALDWGWYVVSGSLTMEAQIEVTGEVGLILCDNSSLFVSSGIRVLAGGRLTVYSQSLGANMGILSAGQSSGPIVINGGFVAICAPEGEVTVHNGDVDVIPPVEEPTQPSGEVTDPTEESTQPSGEATDPTEESTQPSEEATDPTEESTQPGGEATDPTEESTQPSGEATDPTEESTQPSEEATDPTEESTQPSGEATDPTEESTQPSGEATEPTEESTDPTEESTEPTEESTEPTEPVTAEQVQAMIDALPDAETITEENAEEVKARLAAIDEAKAALTDEELDCLDFTRYEAAVTALKELEANRGLCPHHPAHTAECGYIAPNDGAPCRHEHTEVCGEACPHTHDEECGYVEPNPGQPCGYGCKICQVQAMIDALPDAESITEENAEAVKRQLTAIDEAKVNLTDEELDALDITRYQAAVSALMELEGMAGANEPEVLIDNVSYLDADGQTKTASCTEVTADTTTLNVGWYVVNNSVTISNRITVSGDVHLILCDGKTLTASQGINVMGSNSLSIYAQSTGDNMGGLTATSVNNYEAGIGGGRREGGGAVTINGGTVTANGNYGGAGIGGGYYGNGGTVTINGGTVTANGGSGGAGIGGGESHNSGTVTINGGTVTANGGDSAAGIGGGIYGDGTVTINGGVVNATGGSDGAGIGGGYNNQSGNVTITGGIVNATGGSRGAGIGGGDHCINGSDVTISGGTVTANGGNNAAGIGNGASPNGTETLFTTGTNGSAVIVASSISDQTAKGNWSGVILERDSGQVYGGSVTLETDFTIPTGKTLTVPEGVILENNGTIQGDGTLVNNGIIINSGTITVHVTGSGKYGTWVNFDANGGSNPPDRIAAIFGEKYDLPTMEPTREGYAFIGWFTATTGGTQVTNSSNNVVSASSPSQTLYAHWHQIISVNYIDEIGSNKTQPCILVTNQTTLTSGWYVVNSNVTISDRITANGNVHLILCDGCTLNAQQGIAVNDGNALTIYRQANHTGALTAGNPTEGGAAIGANRGTKAGTVTINGGIITASVTHSGGACIGQGGWNGGAGTVTINGGHLILSSSAGEEGAFGSSTTRTISGGIIEYTGSKDTISGATRNNCIVFNNRDTGTVYGNPTIGFSYTLASGKTIPVDSGHTVTVAKGTTLTNNGTIVVNGTLNYGEPTYGRIIGGGSLIGAFDFGDFKVTGDVSKVSYASNTLTIQNGADVTITMRNAGATTTSDRILVPSGAKANITLAGVNIDMRGKSGATAFMIEDGGANATVTLAAGTTNTLKSGESCPGLGVKTGSIVTIKGDGALESTGGSEGAGIGGGHTYNAGTINIQSGTITATGGFDGAGIGGGHSNDGQSNQYGRFDNIHITGGVINAHSPGNAAAIGTGCWAKTCPGSITIENAQVTATTANPTSAAPNRCAAIGRALSKDSGNYDCAVTIKNSIVTAQNVANRGNTISGANGTPDIQNSIVKVNAGSSHDNAYAVYGSHTLSKSWEVPTGTTLFIDSGSSLTVGSGATLTNSGTIYVDGTLTGSVAGSVYYPLTVTDGEASPIVTQNSKTYAKAGDTITLTAEEKVGQSASWTATGVTFTGNTFTMPGNAVTVTAQYENAPTYIVTIPASLTMEGTATIKASNVNVAQGDTLEVVLDTANVFTMTSGEGATLTYEVRMGGVDGVTLNRGDCVLQIPGGTANARGEVTLGFVRTPSEVERYSGTYCGSATFTVKVVTAP